MVASVTLPRWGEVKALVGGVLEGGSAHALKDQLTPVGGVPEVVTDAEVVVTTCLLKGDNDVGYDIDLLRVFYKLLVSCLLA